MKPLKSNNKSQEALKPDEEPVSAILPAEDNAVNYDELDPDLAAELYERELEKKLVKQNKSKKFEEEPENNNHNIPEALDTSGRKKKAAKKSKNTHADNTKEEPFHITPQDMLRIERNQRTILHRAALDQNTDLLRTLCISAETKIENFVVEFIDKPDKFGNTALLTACILNNDYSAKKRPECIEILLKARANPNIRSGLTLWTPLTWCAYYGDLDSVKALLNASAIAYLPDSKGCYPIDYCGLQEKQQRARRKEVIAELVKNLTEVLVEFDKAKLNPGLMEARYKINDSYRFLKLPALKSSLLYWAIYFKLDKREYLEPLLRLDEIYPEMPILSLNRRNCYHACAETGNLEALKLLMESDIMNRRFDKYNKKKLQLGILMIGIDPKKKPEVFKMKGFEFTKAEKDNKVYHKEFMKFTAEMGRWVAGFENEVIKCDQSEDIVSQLRYFELQDDFGNTPLHLASFKGHTQIVKYLLEQETNIELENHEGWQCQELRQHAEIKKLYEDYIALKFLSKNKLELMALSYSLKKRKRELRKNMAKGSTIMYQSHMLVRTTPDVVLVFNTTKKTLTNKLLVHSTSKIKDNKYNDAIIARVNFNIDLIQSRFHCYIAPSLNSTSFYLMIKMDEKDLEQACENNKMKIKEINDYGYKTYDLKRKTDFEPFRSRQRQEITLESLNKIVDLEQLRDLKVLEDVYIMHTQSGLRRISEVWNWRLRRTWLPEPLSSFKDYFREARNINFYATTVLKMYFGEKDSFYFAWFSFYICYLPVLAIPGLIVYIITKVDSDANAIALPVWVTYTSLVSTLIVERWKRKSAEIATRWGTAEMEGVQQEKRKIRKEYSGDEIMSTEIGALTKHNPKTRMMFVYNIMSITVLILLCAMVVASFWGIEQLTIHPVSKGLKDAHPEWTSGKKTFINGVNGLVISLANYIYEWIARALVEKENHKFDDDHEQSLILKIAISKTLNSYVGVLYLTFVIQAEFSDMFLILLALLIVQLLVSFGGLILGPWISYKTNEKNYFRKLTQIAKAQWESHNEENAPKPPESELSFKRAVLDCETGAKTTSEWELDEVELNNIKVEKKDILNYYGDVLVQFGYITMFAPAFPLGPAIALIANLFDIKMKLFSFVSCYKRSIAKKASGIGQWLIVWEIVSIVSIFINGLSLFFNLDPSVDFFMKYFTAKKDDNYSDLVTNTSRLWVFVIVVHVILILKYLAQAIIQDKPGWVQKEEEKEEYNEEMMKRATMEHDVQMKTKILSVSNIQERSKGRHQTNKSSIGNNASIAPSHRERQQMQSLMSEEGRSTPDFDAEKDREKGKEREKEKKVTLVDPTPKEKGAPASAGKGKEAKSESPLRETVTRKDESEVRTVAYRTPETAMSLVPTNLNLNHAIKSLIYNTYTVLEKELITRRIADINRLTTRVIVMCNICQKTKSIYNCKTCNEQICEKCYKDVHNKVNISKHDVVTLEEQAQENNPMVPWPEKIEPLGYLLAKNSNSSEVGYWRKFEYFNFPITKSANHFHTMKVAFNVLYTMYITNNGITKDNEVENVEKALKYTKGGKAERKEEGGAPKGMAKYLVPRDNNVIQVAKELEGDLDLSYEQSLEQFIGLGMFNIEEKFFMNRVAFLNFKRRGAKATFDEFVKKLKILEEGSFESKLFLIFDLIDQDDNGVISRSEFVSIFQYAFMQNMVSGNNIDEVLNELFKSALKVNKKDVFQIVLKSRKLQSLFAAYTQTTSKQILDGI